MKKIAFVFLILILVFVAIKLFNQRNPALPPLNINNITTMTSPTPASSTTNQIKTGKSSNIPFKLPAGFQIGVFAQNLGSPRDLEFSPNGTLLVSVPESGKIAALPDINHDGQADEVKTVLSGLNRPHGLAFNPFDSAQDKLFVVS